MASHRILIIDDDPDFSHLLEYDLKKHGYEVVKACNGEEGLQKASSEKPDLILCDIKMPKVDGYTLVRRIKKDNETKNIPLIILTSYEPMKDMFQMEGVSDYFVKSVNMEGLIKTIEKNLAK